MQLRAFAPGDSWGDAYIWTGTGVRVADDVIEIVGCMEAPTPGVWKALFRTLKAAGWKKVIFKRQVDGECKTHTVDLTRDN